MTWDWKKTIKMGKVTLQPLLNLGSDQYDVLVITHFTSIVLNSFQPFFYAHVSTLASQLVSAPTPLSLKALFEVESVASGSWPFWATREHPAQHQLALTTETD